MDMSVARNLIPWVSKVRIASRDRTGPMIGCAEDPIPQEADIGTVCTFKRLDWGGEGEWDVLVLVRPDGQHLYAVNEDCEPGGYIEVIVSPCRWNGSRFALCGNRVHESKHTTPSEALALAMSLRGENLSVIIRPSFIETDAEGVESYREWRSFNGSNFKEIRFYCGGARIPDSKEVTDDEVALPKC